MKKLAVTPALLCLALSAFAADEAVSPPVGGVTVTLAAAVSGVPKITTFSLPMRLPVGSAFVGKSIGTFTGVSDGASNGTFTDSTAGWTASGLVQPGAPYFVRIKSGASAGSWWQIAANTSTTLTVTANRGFTPAASGISPGDAYEIVPGDTLATLLSSVELTGGGTSMALADNVRIHDGASWRQFYFNTSEGVWREGLLPGTRDNFIIRPDTGVFYTRKSATPLSLVLIGNVSTIAEKVAVGATGVTVIGNVHPVSRSVGSLNIQSSPALIRNTGSLSAADKVNHYDGVSWHYYSFISAEDKWKELIFDRTTFNLPFGVPMVIARGTSATTSFWVTLPLPYTL